MESSELGPLWRRSLKSSKSIPLRSIDGSNPTIAPGASQSYCARIALIVARADFQVRSTRSLKMQLRTFYLTAEQPHISAVIEEVNLQCFKAGLKKPAANTVRRRIATLSDRLKLEKRKGKKAAAEKYEPIKGALSWRRLSVCRRPDRSHAHGCHRGR